MSALLLKIDVQARYYRLDDIRVTLEDVQTTILRVFKFLATIPSINHIGLKDMVKGLATLGEPSQVTNSVAQLLTPYVNTFPRFALLVPV